MKVNRSTYYKHFHTEPSARTLENQEIRKTILQIYTDYQKRPGAYKIAHVLERDYGVRISVGRVYRLMQTMDLPKMSTRKPKFVHASDDIECTNHLAQKFYPEEPNQVWASDTTYIRVGSKWFYLCVIIDLFSRKVIAWKISGQHNVDLIIDTFNLAYESRNKPQYLMFHSDRGCQYTAYSFRKLLDSCDVLQSFSRKGYPFDNAVVESFFKYLKQDEVNRRTYHTLQELQLSIFEYIEGYYNSRRPHGTLNMLTPNEKEALYFESL